MHRREFLQSATALMASAGLPWAGLFDAAAQAAGLKPLGNPAPFSFDTLKTQARELAARPYVPPRDTLPPAIAGMDWDQWQSIRFKEDHSLWADQESLFQARFFHLGFTIKSPCACLRSWVVRPRNSRTTWRCSTTSAVGSIRRLCQGSRICRLSAELSYRLGPRRRGIPGGELFRAVGGEKQYGQSARGLAINCGMPEPEEFPNFIAYYLDRPKSDVGSVTVYGLLDSPSMCGAYRFVMTPGDSFLMDIDAAISPRKAVERLGIAPLTSMYQYGENDGGCGTTGGRNP